MTLHHLCCTPYQRRFVVWLVSLIVSLCQPLSCQRTSAIRHALHRLTMSQPRLSSATIVCSASRVGIAATTYDCLLHPAKACSSAISTIYQWERLCSHCTQRCSTLPGGLALTVCVISKETKHTKARPLLHGTHALCSRLLAPLLSMDSTDQHRLHRACHSTSMHIIVHLIFSPISCTPLAALQATGLTKYSTVKERLGMKR